VSFCLNATPNQGETIIVNFVKGYDQILSVLSLYVIIHVSLVILHVSNATKYLLADGANSLR
jgi:hypothetical protein